MQRRRLRQTLCRASSPAPLRYSVFRGGAAPRVISDAVFTGSNPEGICYLDFGNGSDYLILSDDGTRKFNGKECKTLPEAQRQFRAYRYSP